MRGANTDWLSAHIDSAIDRVMYDLVQSAASHHGGQNFNVLLLSGTDGIVVVLLCLADLKFIVAHIITPVCV